MFYKNIKKYIIGINIAGSRFATLIFVIPNISRDNPNIKIPPMAVISVIKALLAKELKRRADRAITP